MKQTKTTKPILIAAALCAIALGFNTASAIPITGSIGFGASGVTIDNANLSGATTFNVSSPFTTTETGTYSTVPLYTSVTFHGFQFNPPANSLIPVPLWTFNIGAITYSFDTTSVSSYYNASLQQWDIGGTGVAMVTGFTDTVGTWNVNLSQSGTSVVFNSSAGVVAAGVPEGGSALLLLGGSLLCIGSFGSKRFRFNL